MQELQLKRVLFLSKVDREKYPETVQDYRFELQEIPSVKNREENSTGK